MKPDQRKDLVDRWLTGELDAAGEAELDRLLSEDAEFARELLEQQQMEQALRILLADGAKDRQVTDSVLSVLRAEPLEDFKAGLMERVREASGQRRQDRVQDPLPEAPPAAAPKESPSRKPAPRATRRWMPFAAAAAALLAAGLVWLGLGEGGSEAEGTAFLLSSSGEAAVRRGPQRLRARADLGLLPQDRLVLEEGAHVRVGYSDDPSLIEIQGPAELRLLQAGQSKRLELLRGVFLATIPRQAEAFRIQTAHAELRLDDARARLQAAAEFSRVEVAKGEAAFLRLSDRRSVRVPADHYAVAGAGAELAARPIGSEAPAPGGPEAVAVVKKAEGGVFAFEKSPAERVPLKTGQPVLSTQGVLTEGLRSELVLEYPDRTRVEIAGNARVRRLVDEKDAARKRVLLEQGSLTADVHKQVPGKPMILSTPQAEATVLGTRFVLAAEGDATRLSVEEGAVSFLRHADRKAVTVRSGFTSLAAPGRDLEPTPIPGGVRYLDLDLAAGVPDGDGDWAVDGRVLRQRKVSRLAEGGRSSLLFPAQTSDSLVVEATVTLDRVTPDTDAVRGAWGFGLEAMFRNRGLLLRSLQGPENASVFEFFGASAIPFEHGREGVYRLKLAIDRRREGEAVLRGKIWQGDREPDGWMIENQLDLEGPLVQVGLQTVRCACTFESFKVKLLREEPR